MPAAVQRTKFLEVSSWSEVAGQRAGVFGACSGVCGSPQNCSTCAAAELRLINYTLLMVSPWRLLFLVREHRPDHTHFRPTQRAYIDTHTHSHIHPSTVHGSAGLPVAVIRHISAFTGDLQRCVEGLIHPPSWPGFLLQFPCWSLKHLTSEILVCFRSCLVVLVLCTLFPPSVFSHQAFEAKTQWQMVPFCVAHSFQV